MKDKETRGAQRSAPVDDFGRVEVERAAQDLVEEDLHVVGRECLRRHDDAVQVRLHQLAHHVDLVERLHCRRRLQDVDRRQHLRAQSQCSHTYESRILLRLSNAEPVPCQVTQWTYLCICTLCIRQSSRVSRYRSCASDIREVSNSIASAADTILFLRLEYALLMLTPPHHVKGSKGKEVRHTGTLAEHRGEKGREEVA